MVVLAQAVRTKSEILDIYTRHVDTVYRVCFAFMKTPTEAEDMVQETFLKLMVSGKSFENERHERAWLIVTASNACKDALRKWWRKHESIEDCDLPVFLPDMDNPVLDAILSLPNDYKDAVYMFYYEGYSTAEIARHAKCPEATVRSRLSRARKQLQTILGGEEL